MATVSDTQWDPNLRSLFEHMNKVEASDLYLTAGSPPVFRIDGVGYPAKTVLDGATIDAMAMTLLTPPQRAELVATKEMNVALASSAGGRFRVNLFYQRGEVGLVARLVRTTIKTLTELQHPPILADIMASKCGLVLLVGGTGSGKSTTLAAMIDHRNASDTGHIITIEDPIEFIHPHKQCVVTQREVGVDTLSYRDALKNTLRQAPDVILIGEIRDVETMEAAITFAETGHLCISTLHANNANQALERILNFFPQGRLHEIRLQLSLNLRAIISQRLVPSLTGGRAAALEVLVDTPRIRDLIKKGATETIKEAMEQGTNEGCATFDQSLFELFRNGRIAAADALTAADSPNNLRLRLDRVRRQGGTIDEPELRLVKAEPVVRALPSDRKQPPAAELAARAALRNASR
jgi:twitching motility protein PilU